jgi:hypothetical protein
MKYFFGLTFLLASARVLSQNTFPSSGNVGIGTPIPYYALDVATSDNNYQQLRIKSPGSPLLKLSGSYNSGNGAEIWQTPAGDLFLNINSGSTGMIIKSNGNLGIGTNSPDAKLAVSGQVHAQEIKVSIAVPGPDYVFEKNYNLPSLEEIKSYIDQNKHLPEVPSAKEMEKNGVQLGEMNMLLLRKIEELTLYIINQDKQIAELKERSVSPDVSGKKIEELTLYVIEQEKRAQQQENRIKQLESQVKK